MSAQETKQTNRDAVCSSAAKIIARLSVDSSASRAEAARWRHGLGRPMGDDPALYGEFLLQLEPMIRPRDGYATPAEEAVWMAVQMYLVSGKRQKKGVSLGRACRLSGDENIHKRLIIAENAADFAQLREPLRAVIQLLSTAKNNVYMDYEMLAGDLYSWYYDPLRVVRQWERDYAFED